jgi:membrane protein implicated in regulation of membrane protease activity
LVFPKSSLLGTIGSRRLLSNQTHGLTWWQQACLVAIFAVVFIWAVIATWVARTGNRRNTTSKEELTLRERLFELSKDVKEFLKSFGDEPEWIFTAVDKSEVVANFNSDNKERIDRSTKLKHGF